ncbi:MAG: motility associated factor glycosyltransferase family protein [Campylobacteraceae bacterium]|nr:motility associated factor glycosyltransferase family protein [Campylobacteraceae bacterium]
MNDITNKVLKTYNNNLEFLKQKDSELYNKVILLEQAIEENLYKENFFLEFKDDKYFDIFADNSQSFIYNQDTYLYGEKEAKKVNYLPSENSFKTFYDFSNIPNNLLTSYSLMDVNGHHFSCIASILSYINTNTPKKQTLQKINKFLFLGVGLGTHIQPIHNKIKANTYFIAEENLEIFRLSLFTTNYYEIAKDSAIKFSISDTEEVFKKKFNDYFNYGFVFNHFLKFNLFSKNAEKFVTLIQSCLTEQDHYLFPYHRPYTTIERLFNRKKENILDVSKLHESFKNTDKPILILASGPSSKYNEEWLKENQDKFIIVAIFASLSFCEKNSIKPDIIIQIDEYEIATEIILKKVKSKKLFEDSIFVLGSAVHQNIEEEFQKNKKFFVQMNRINMHESLGRISATSVGEFTYCLLLKLGFKEIYLLGLDLALDPTTNKSHADDHHANKELNNNDEIEEVFSITNSTFKIKGNFQKEVYTTTLFYTSIKLFNQMSRVLKEDWQNVYNLNNGAFLEGAQPKRVEEIDMLNFKNLDKLSLNQDLFSSLNSISKNIISESDLEILNIKLNNAYKVKKVIDNFAEIKSYSNSSIYMKKILELISTIVKHKDIDNLSDILYNYFQFIIHYIVYFFHLKEVDNHKKHIKKINKLLIKELYRLVDKYIEHYEELLKK